MSDTLISDEAAWLVDAAGDFLASPSEVESAGVQAERDGYDGLLVAETRHDPFISLALAARATSRLELASSIAVAFARSPMTVATLANDIQLVSGGRFSLGLGSQVKAHIERRFSMPWSHPAARMEEYVRALHAIWDAWETGEPLRFEGRFYQHTLMPPFFNPGPNPHGRPPVLLAGVGAQMTRVAGGVADGFLAHTLTTAAYLRDVTRPALEKGREAAGRTDRVPVLLPAFVAVAVEQPGLDVAVEGVRKQLSFYCSTPAYLPVLEHHGWDELHHRLLRLSTKGEWAAMPDLVDDEVLAQFAAIGTPQEVAQTLDGRFGGLVDRLSFSMPYSVAPDLPARVAAFLRGATDPGTTKET